MGNYLKEPNREKHTKSQQGPKYSYAVSEMQGWRKTMEDACVHTLDLGDGNSLFGVFDGHGGSEVSNYVITIFERELKNSQAYKQKQYQKALRQTFKHIDQILLSEEGQKGLHPFKYPNLQKKIETSQPQKHSETTQASKSTQPSQANKSSQAKQENQANKPNQANKANQVNEPNQANQANKLNQANQPNQVNKPNEVNQPHQASQANKPTQPNQVSHPLEVSQPNEVNQPHQTDKPSQATKTNQVIKAKKQVIGTDAGTTANVLLITPSAYFVANIGDSRSVLCRQGKSVDLSVDHRTTCPAEEQRIKKAGGQVIDGRINGGLNLTRAFGDFNYKESTELTYDQQIVTCDPVIEQFEITDKDQFIVMGCDGVWDRYVSNSQGLIDIVSQEIKSGKDLKTVVQEVLDGLLPKSPSKSGIGCDNMSIILIRMNH